MISKLDRAETLTVLKYYYKQKRHRSILLPPCSSNNFWFVHVSKIPYLALHKRTPMSAHQHDFNGRFSSVFCRVGWHISASYWLTERAFFTPFFRSSSSCLSFISTVQCSISKYLGNYAGFVGFTRFCDILKVQW